MSKERYRILFPRTDGKDARKPDKKFGLITHWIVCADMKRHGYLNFGVGHFAIFETGKFIQSYFRNPEFNAHTARP